MAGPLVRIVLTAVVLCAAAGGLRGDVVRQDGPFVGGRFDYTVRDGETMSQIAARFAVPAATLSRHNGLVPTARLRAGQTIQIDNRHVIPDLDGRALALNIAQRLLYFSRDDGVHAYPVGVGTAGWPTPVGAFEVVDLEIDPAWDVPVSIQEEMRQQGKPVLTRVPPGPGNPLGSRFIRLSFFNLGIHGTSDPSSIYRYVSHGCIRMHPGDIEELFPQVTIGMSGVSLYQPVLMTTLNGRVFLEVHADAYKRAVPPLVGARALADSLGVASIVEWNRAEAAIRDRSGIAVDVTQGR